MCKVRFVKYVNNILNILGKDMFLLKKKYEGGLEIKFQGGKIRYNGAYTLMRPPTRYFNGIESSPDEISSYNVLPIGSVFRCSFTLTAYDVVYLEVNGTVYIDRR